MSSKVEIVTVNTPLNSSSFQQQINHNFSVIEESLNKQLQREPQEDVNNEMEQELDMNSHRIINVAEPVNNSDAATKHYVDTTVKPELEANKVVVSDSNGDIVSSSITTTELNTLSGISGNIQEQIDSKQDTISDLAEIRAGAAAGATALQSTDLKTINGESVVGEGDIVTQNLIAGNNITISDNTISAPVMTGASSLTAGTSGTVPQPAIGDQVKFLRGDGTWVDLGTVMRYKGSVATYADLPSSGMEVGDVWNVLADGKNYAWTGTAWDDFGGAITVSIASCSDVSLTNLASGDVLVYDSNTSKWNNEGNVLKNTATGTNSLTINGTVATGYKAVNIGSSSIASNDEDTALGYNAIASGSHSTALGAGANVTGTYGIQIGYGTNSTAHTLNVGLSVLDNFLLLNSSGNIPIARLGATAGDTDKFLKGDGTWANVGGGSLTDIASAGSNITFTTLNVIDNIAATDKIGSPTITTEGLFTPTDSSYLQITSTSVGQSVGTIFSGGYAWELTIKFRTPASYTNASWLWVYGGSIPLPNAGGILTDQGKIGFNFKVSNWESYTGTTTLDTDTDYYAKFIYDTNVGKYFVQISQDGTNWTTEIESTSGGAFYGGTSQYLYISNVSSSTPAVQYDLNGLSLTSDYNSTNWKAYTYNPNGKTEISSTIPASVLVNTSSATNALGVGTSSSANENSTAVGIGANANGGIGSNTAIGYGATANSGSCLAVGNSSVAKNGSVAVGNSAVAGTYSATGCTAIGHSSSTSGTDSTAIGYNSSANGGVTVGAKAQSDSTGIAIGKEAKANGTGAIQIGAYGTNNTDNTMNVALAYNLNVQLLDNTGKIPVDRYTAFTGTDGVNAGTKGCVPAPTASDADKFLKSDGTWASAGGGGSVTLNDIAEAGSNISFVDNTTDYTIAGSCSVDSNYIATNFGLNDYIVSGAEIPQSATTWEIGTKVHTANSLSGNAFIFSGLVDETISAGLYQSSATLNAGNGSWFGGAVYEEDIAAANKDMWYKLIFDGTKYSLQTSLDGVYYSEAAYLTNSTKILSTKVKFGVTESGALVQSIDLKETYIKVNGVETWRGASVGKTTINADVLLTDIAQAGSNITFTPIGQNNVTIVGSPTVTGNVISDFSDSNYIIGTHTAAEGPFAWKASVKFKTGSLSPTRQRIMSHSDVFMMSIDSGYLAFEVWGAGFSWYVSNIAVSSNTTYFMEIEYDGNTTYTYRYKNENDLNWTDIRTETGTFSTGYVSTNNQIYLGRVFNLSDTGKYFDGSIDLTETYFEINGVKDWDGLKDIRTEISSSTPKETYTNPALTASGDICTWTVSHTLGTRDVIATVYDTTTYKEILAEVIHTDANTLTINITSSSDISAGTYKVVIIG